MERPVRQVTIYEFTRTSEISYEEGLARFRFRVKCSKGTYIRALARDLGEAMNSGAHLTALRRTRVGDYTIDDAMSLDRALELIKEGPVEFPDEPTAR